MNEKYKQNNAAWEGYNTLSTHFTFQATLAVIVPFI